MPTYDYKCLECNFTFEEFQKMTDDPIQECPECSGSVKRLIGAGAAPIFKGSGFYQTDYKNNGSNKKKASDAKDNTKSEPKPLKKESKKEK